MRERGVMNNPSETVNAAATAIASAGNRVNQDSTQKRSWGSCWRIYWCFGSHKQSKRIGHAVFVPEATTARADGSAAANSTQTHSITLPFIAPPSSPASFLPSDPPSSTQSPAGLLSLTTSSTNIYSPGGHASMFAIGPYAHETQLVSPPVFSTFTTEPSTAPFTPPPESVHLTTPSSPEVPFAMLLDPGPRNIESGMRFPQSQYEYQSYNRWKTGETAFDHRVSFEVTAEQVVRCVEKKPDRLNKAASTSLNNEECILDKQQNPWELANERASAHEDTGRHEKYWSVSKEFNFDMDGGNNVGPDWWAYGNGSGGDGIAIRNWSFPLMHPGVS